MKMIKIDSYRKLGLVCALVFVLAVSIFASINVFAQSTRLTVTPDNIVLMDDLDNITKTSSLPWDNITDTAPIGPYSYMIYVDPSNSSLYHAMAANGTICFTSTNLSTTVLNINNQMPTTGGTIKFIGSYNLDYGLYFNASYTIYDLTGANFKKADGANKFFNLIQVYNTRNVTILNGVLDGNRLNQVSGGIDQYQNGIMFVNASFCKVTGTEVKSFNQAGIICSHSSDTIGPEFPSYPDTGNNQLFIINTRVNDCPQDGIHFHLATDSIIKDNIISNVGRHGIYGYLSDNNSITGNIITNVNSLTSDYQGGNGISLQLSNNALITGNTISKTNASSITVLVSTGSKISNNILSDSTIGSLIEIDQNDGLEVGLITGQNALKGILLDNTNNSFIGSGSVIKNIQQKALDIRNSNNNTVEGKYTKIMISQFSYDSMVFDANCNYNVISVDVRDSGNNGQSILSIAGSYNVVQNCFMRGSDVNVHLINGATYNYAWNNVFYSKDGDFFYDQSGNSYNVGRNNYQNGVLVANGLN